MQICFYENGFLALAITFRKYGSQPPTCSKVFNVSYVSFSIHFPDER